jgi:acylphosphatase
VDQRVAVHVVVSGRVQGVYYRHSAAEQARAGKVAGWARNLPDGRVELWAEGGREAVDAFLAWCRAGPRSARVTGLVIEDVAPAGAMRFEVY